ncbi:hypothetical protein LL946_10655 [Knoellia locipacati]|uniref:hypothetical protein n=1 Tax=Knoellia locipacati TaxID=882824 RepID=UPI00384D1532
MTTMTTSSPDHTASRSRALSAWLRWTFGFLAFPLAGLAGTAVAGRVDSPWAALLGGLGAGAVLGLGQSLLSSGRLPMARWTAVTSTGMGAGLLLGAATVDYGTSIGDLAVMGALSGAVLGVAQAVTLPHRTRSRWVWAVAMPALWAIGWSVSTLVIGDAVHEQFTLYGASGAITVSALLGVLLHLLLPVSTTGRTPTPRATPTTGDPS